MKKILLLSIFLLSIASPFAMLHAQTGSPGVDYKLLEPLPLNNPSGPLTSTTNTKQYIEGFIKLIIAVAGGLAVLRIIIGGVQYMTTEAFSGKSAAKETILNAIIGFLLAAGSFLIVTTVNPDLATLNLSLQNVGSTKPLDTSIASSTSTDVGSNSDSSTDCDATHTCDYSSGGAWGPLENGITLAGIPQKPCLVFAPYACQISNYPAFYSQLFELNRTMSGMGLGWQITEAWPPSYKKHVDSCHQPGPTAGDCVDAALLNKSSSPQDIKKFLTAIKDSGFSSFQYEVTSQARYDAIRQAVGSGFKLTLNTNATGEHAHINFR